MLPPQNGNVGLVKQNYINFQQNGGCFDGSCGGPYVYRGKAIAIHVESSVNSSSRLTAETLRLHQIEQEEGDKKPSDRYKKMKIADAETLAEDSCAASHTSSFGS